MNDIMKTVFEELLEMDSGEFMKSLDKEGDISNITRFLNALHTSPVKIVDCTFETYDQDMNKPIDVKVTIIKPRKPEHIKIESVIHPGMHMTI